jgi:outer membrane protein assembly factor BamE (lipoprotein component of BamABCDE complex)
MKKLTTLLGLACALVLFSACVGTTFNWDTARQVRVGMTKAEVQQVMGKPYLISTAGEDEVWTWAYGTGLGNGAAFKIILRDDKVTQVPKIPAELK